MKHSWLGLVALVMVGLVIGACKGKGEAVASSSAPAVKAVKDLEPFSIIIETDPIGNPLAAIAREKHYFEEEGINANFVVLSSGGIEALSLGKADLYLFTIIPPLSYAAQGSDIKVIGGTASGGNYVITKPENIEKYAKLEDWRGVRLGTVRLSTSEMVSRYALGPLGVDLGSEVTFVEIDTYPNIIEAVRKGQVDIGFVSANYRQSAFDLGLQILFPMTEMYDNYVCCRETANGKSLANKRDLFVKFHQAQIRAYKDFKEKQEESIAILAKLSSQEPDYVRNVIFNVDTNGHRVFNPDPDLKRVTAVYETLKASKYIQPPEGFNASDIVDYTVYADALQNILSRFPNDPVYQKLYEEFKANNLDI
jgi:NitT/TauT family transport system substrate-binding protein